MENYGPHDGFVIEKYRGDGDGGEDKPGPKDQSCSWLNVSSVEICTVELWTEFIHITTTISRCRKTQTTALHSFVPKSSPLTPQCATLMARKWTSDALLPWL